MVFLAERGGQALAAVLCLIYKDNLSMLYLGTDYRALGYHPVRVTDWAAIEWGCARGLQRLDFLMTPLRNEGLRWYKRSFGRSKRRSPSPTIGGSAGPAARNAGRGPFTTCARRAGCSAHPGAVARNGRAGGLSARGLTAAG